MMGTLHVFLRLCGKHAASIGFSIWIMSQLNPNTFLTNKAEEASLPQFMWRSRRGARGAPRYRRSPGIRIYPPLQSRAVSILVPYDFHLIKQPFDYTFFGRTYPDVRAISYLSSSSTITTN